ncbi:hypothetical protein ACMA5I_00935 [Paracoccaceae bacterium GXU_MW_L88]
MFQEWPYLLGEIWVLLALATLLGLAAGWLIFGHRRGDEDLNADALRRDLAACRQASQQKDQTISMLETRLDSLAEADGTDQSAEVERLRSEVAERDAELRELEARIAENEARPEAISDAVEGFSQADHDELTAQLAAREEAIRALETRIAESENRAAELAAVEPGIPQQEHDAVKAELVARDDVIRDLEAKIAAQETAQAEASPTIRVEDHEALKTALSERDDTIRALETRLTESENRTAAPVETGVSQQEHDELLEALRARDMELRVLHDRIASFQEESDEKAGAAAAARVAQSPAMPLFTQPVQEPAAAEPMPGPQAAEPAETGTRPQSFKAPRGGVADDLKLISGIGPKLERQLHGLGFFHFDQIADWTQSEIDWVDTHLEGFNGRVTRDNWVAQAHVLANGGTAEDAARLRTRD